MLLALDGLRPPARRRLGQLQRRRGEASPTGRSPRPRRSSAATGSSRRARPRRRSSGRSAARVENCRIEVRPIFEMEDFPPDVREADRLRPRAASGRLMAATADARAAVEAVWRIESARLVAGLARLVRDVGLAEDLAQDALVAALERWPRDGVPDNPGAWLMATAKNRAIDLARRASTYERKREEVAHELRDHAGDGRRRLRRRGRRRGRRRPAGADVHLLPSGALDRGAGGADAAPARRADDGGDRPRLPRRRADRGAAADPGEADAARGARRLRGAGAGARCGRGCPTCSRSST